MAATAAPAPALCAVEPPTPRLTVHVVAATEITCMISPVLPSQTLNGVAGKPALLATLTEVWNALMAAASVVCGDDGVMSPGAEGLQLVMTSDHAPASMSA